MPHPYYLLPSPADLNTPPVSTLPWSWQAKRSVLGIGLSAGVSSGVQYASNYPRGMGEVQVRVGLALELPGRGWAPN